METTKHFQAYINSLLWSGIENFPKSAVYDIVNGLILIFAQRTNLQSVKQDWEAFRFYKLYNTRIRGNSTNSSKNTIEWPIERTPALWEQVDHNLGLVHGCVALRTHSLTQFHSWERRRARSSCSVCCGWYDWRRPLSRSTVLFATLRHCRELSDERYAHHIQFEFWLLGRLKPAVTDRLPFALRRQQSVPSVLSSTTPCANVLTNCC